MSSENEKPSGSQCITPQPCKMSDGTASSLKINSAAKGKDTTPVTINVELIQTRDSENLTIQQKVVTVVEAKWRLVQWLNKAYGIQPFQFDEALVNVIPYVPLRALSDEGVTIITAMSQYYIFGTKTHGLLVFEMRETLADNPMTLFKTVNKLNQQLVEQKADKEKKSKEKLEEDIDTQKSIALLLSMCEKQQRASEAQEKHIQVLLNSSRAQQKEIQAQQKEIQAQQKEIQEGKEKVQYQYDQFMDGQKQSQAQQKDIKRMQKRILRLETELEKEQKRNLDTEEFMADGCRQDSAAYQRIKIRHLLTLTQAKLAEFLELSQRGTMERDASIKWREYCRNVADDETDDETRAQMITAVLRLKQPPNTIEELIESGVLEILVNDKELRTVCDRAAHPGAVTEDNGNSYMTAVNSYAQAQGDETLGTRLKACVTFLLQHSSST